MRAVQYCRDCILFGDEAVVAEISLDGGAEIGLSGGDSADGLNEVGFGRILQKIAARAGLQGA